MCCSVPDECEPYLIPETCQFCKKESVYYTAHGMRDGKLYDEFSCVHCFAARNRVSKEKVEQLESEED